MGKLALWIGRRQLWKKLFVFVVLLSIVPLIALSTFMRSTAENNIMAVSRQSADSAMDIIAYNIDQQFQKYYYLAYFLTRDEQLKSLSTLSNVQAFNRDVIRTTNCQTLMRGYRQSVLDVQCVGVAFENGLLLTSASKYAGEYNLKEQAWYRQCVDNADASHLIMFPANTGPFEGAQAPVDIIMACQAIVNREGDCIGASMVIMHNNILAQSSTNVLDRNGSFVYITDESGALVYSPIVGERPSVLDEGQYARIVRHIPSFGWDIIGMMRIHSAVENVNALNRLVYLSCLLVSLAVAVGAALLCNRILRPITSLNLLMKRAQVGDLAVRFSPSGNDEINELGLSFNIMLDKIQELLDQVYCEQMAKRKAEVAALQVSIQPHFLYNTLDTICWMASQYKAHDIVRTVESLGTLFRISLSKGNELVPIEQEARHVTSYLQIQKVRYEDMVEYSVQVDDECRGYLVQKIIMQPLVENAIYHGIKESGRSGFIQVDVSREGDALVLCVQDDGIGIPPGRLAELQAQLQGAAHRETGAYGIVNVQERLVLNYGREYGLTLSSEYGQGVRCVIRHPLIKE